MRDAIGPQNPHRSILFAMLVIAVVTATAKAQIGGEVISENADEVGQMNGPYMLEGIINLGGPTGDEEWHEIAHMVTLPHPNSGYVLLWCQRTTERIGESLMMTWLWDSRDPNWLIPVVVPNDTGDMTGLEDIFCGAHTFSFAGDANGKLVVMGGTNMPFAVGGSAVGTRGVFEFNNERASLPQEPQWTDVTSQSLLNEERYYNGCLTDDTGQIVTFGNSGLTSAGGNSQAVKNREYYNGGPWTKSDNIEWDTTNQCNITAKHALSTLNYADLHLLMSGNWIRVDAQSASTVFFDKARCNQPPDLDPVERFVRSTAGTNFPSPYGSSVHYLYFDDNDDRREVIYAIGGSDDYNDCMAPATYVNTVMRIVDPAVGVAWDTSPPNLAVARASHNLVILLDGSILVVGGADWDVQTTSCLPVLSLELYKPPGIFANGSTSWEAMMPLALPRTYHSVVTLLPDGSVVIGGGVGNNMPPNEWQASWHSLEHYRPPYFFQPGTPRPRITSVSAGVWIYGQQNIYINVAFMHEEGGEFRVALLAPCSRTHNIDFSQRYVEVLVDSVDPDPASNSATITVFAPENSSVAPPGWYMLTVVNKDGLPSAATWVQVQ